MNSRPFTHRAVFWIACFASIAMLLAHVQPIARMSITLWALGLPAAAAMAWAALSAARAADADFLLRLKIGLLGGIIGTLGYDLVRIPIHYMGQNPLAPIRAYGMWIAGADHSSPATDLLGVGYHFSNGVTFGWIYSVVALRRSWVWGIVWGLALETLAVMTPFGEVFAIRSNYSMLGVAYAAHLFYGLPLGLACRYPEAALRGFWPMHRTPNGWGVMLMTGLFIAWFLSAFQPWSGQPPLARGQIVIGPDAIHPGWTDAPIASSLTLRNASAESAKIILRPPKPPGADSAPLEWTLSPGETRSANLDRCGVYQLLAPDTGWRSVFVAVHGAGNYRLPPR